MVNVRENELLQGVLDKAQFGASAYGLVHSVCELCTARTRRPALLPALGRLFTHFLRTKAAYTCGLVDMGTGGGHAATAGARGLSSNAGGNMVGLPGGTGGDAGGVGGGESKDGGALPDAKGRKTESAALEGAGSGRTG